MRTGVLARSARRRGRRVRRGRGGVGVIGGDGTLAGRDDRREQLLRELERYYGDCGWNVERPADSTVRAAGGGGVTWIGLAVVASDLADERFPARLLELSEQRMPRGELCPLELLPDDAAAAGLRRLLDGLGLAERGHVEVYSLAA